MKQAQVTTWGQTPQYLDAPTPALPDPSSDLVQIKVLASGLPTLVRSRAAGTHYSANVLPHVPGVDGVGTTVPDGKLVYFTTITPTGGSFAEFVNVPRKATTPVPEQIGSSKADPVQIAGQMNPVMASWMALAARTKDLPKGFTAVIVGATGLAGAAAAGVARVFGAAKVVGVARSKAKMEGLGLDAAIELDAVDAAQTDYAEALDADVILDFLYGPPTLALLRALKPSKPVQYVQIGTVVQRDMALPGDILRSKDITIRGAGPGAWQMGMFAVEAPKMVEAIVAGKVRPYSFQEVKLSDIEVAWGQKGGDRMVLIP
ncbi:alcohol dehydrogenase [Lasiodiplodia theobromae]|uniref:alcohol dehydrogenase n=1 Tax=Lasiodiplodia theobromae TaxID=45133 RepID=UPI0015C3161D|nr:alcohol dehydrogenase [Lasiodiplodia theobromae]KAF4541094.1 alcohol dehydrogenase [Lasiodiplodia theobromae]